jgi:hypothetical protein
MGGYGARDAVAQGELTTGERFFTMLATLTTWLQANCPAAAVRENILAAAVRADSQHHDFHAGIGSRLTNTGSAYLVQSYHGHLFVFALGADQAENCGVKENGTTFCLGSPRPPITVAPALVLEGFEIESSVQHSWFEPLRCRCGYVSAGPLPKNLCLRGEMVVRQLSPANATARHAMFCYPSLMPGANSIEFQFGPSCRQGQPPHFATPQTTAVFLTICTTPDPRQAREALTLSDALGALVTFH